MKKILCVFLLFFSLLVGCTVKGNSPDNASSLRASITLDEVIKMFEKHDLELNEQDDIHPDNAFNHTLANVDPALYNISQDQKLSIYVYSSKDDVEKGIADFENKTATATVNDHTMYDVHNVLLFHILGAQQAADPRVKSALEELQQN